jgi:ribosomal protein S18 acetylase RimI-like enzyme
MISASDAYIERYVAAIDFDAGFVLGAFEDGHLSGIAHAAADNESGTPMLEVGLSVDHERRRRGLGRELLRECLVRARQNKAGPVVVLYQSSNDAMSATARSLGGVVSIDGVDTRAEFPSRAAVPTP